MILRSFQSCDSMILPCNTRIFFSRGIFLKSFRIKPSELKEKLYIIHEESGGLTDEQITTLRR